MTTKLSFLCPVCRKRVTADKTMAAKKGRCPSCRSACTVPSGPSIQKAPRTSSVVDVVELAEEYLSAFYQHVDDCITTARETNGDQVYDPTWFFQVRGDPPSFLLQVILVAKTLGRGSPVIRELAKFGKEAEDGYSFLQGQLQKDCLEHGEEFKLGRDNGRAAAAAAMAAIGPRPGVNLEELIDLIIRIIPRKGVVRVQAKDYFCSLLDIIKSYGQRAAGAVSRICQLLREPGVGSEAKAAVIDCLFAIATPEVATELLDVLILVLPDAPVACCEALAEIGEKTTATDARTSIIDAVGPYVRHKNTDVRLAAAVALERLGERPNVTWSFTVRVFHDSCDFFGSTRGEFIRLAEQCHGAFVREYGTRPGLLFSFNAEAGANEFVKQCDLVFDRITNRVIAEKMADAFIKVCDQRGKPRTEKERAFPN